MIPTLNAQNCLPACLEALIPAVVAGLVGEVIIVDGGSQDLTEEIAEETGAVFVRTALGRGTQLAAGAAIAKGDWLLFLHADTVLDVGWEREVAAFMARAEAPEHPQAAAFRFALDDTGARPRLLEILVGLRSSVLRLPYGDQGLLLPRQFYEAVGGFRKIPLMEDIDLVRRLKRGQLAMLRTKAVTSAVRYQREGYVRRTGRNLICLLLYYVKAPLSMIARFYD